MKLLAIRRQIYSRGLGSSRSFSGGRSVVLGDSVRVRNADIIPPTQAELGWGTLFVAGNNARKSTALTSFGMTKQKNGGKHHAKRKRLLSQAFSLQVRG
ncbi:hypothetical protein [Silvibacterium acidisoli]|uniref:hypothetical protein n=1 Tax=Acidobacteriaceae bacterium ZG23-2 TaxID=2883246 RepID=UPI00406CBC5A